MPRSGPQRDAERLASWITRKVQQDHNVDLGTSPDLRRQIDELSARVVAKFNATPLDDIRVTITWGSSSRPSAAELTLTPSLLNAILGRAALAVESRHGSSSRVPPPPPPPPPPLPPPPEHGRARLPEEEAPPFSSPMAPRTLPPAPSAIAARPEPGPKPTRARRPVLLASVAVLGVVGVVAAGILVVASAGGDDESSEDPASATSAERQVQATLAPPTSTSTPSSTPSRVAQSPTPTATPRPSPSPTPTATPAMRVGREVLVVNTKPDPCLYLRPEPDRTVGPLTCLLEGTVVRLVRGPNDRDGIRWWYVEVPDYNGKRWEGYAAERQLGSETAWLIPRSN